MARDDGSIFMSGVPGEDKALISLPILFTSTPIILHFETKIAACYSKCFIVTKPLLENVGKNSPTFTKLFLAKRRRKAFPRTEI